MNKPVCAGIKNNKKQTTDKYYNLKSTASRIINTATWLEENVESSDVKAPA